MDVAAMTGPAAWMPSVKVGHGIGPRRWRLYHQTRFKEVGGTINRAVANLHRCAAPGRASHAEAKAKEAAPKVGGLNHWLTFQCH